MRLQRLFSRIDDRIAQHCEEGDSAYFHGLLLKLEYLTKIVTSAVVACVGDDADSHRYALEYKIIRSDSIGQWVKLLNEALVGPPAQFLYSDARSFTRDLTRRVDSSNWRFSAVSHLADAASHVGAVQAIGHKVALRQFFDIGVQIRNRTRGHGATTLEQSSRASKSLDSALEDLVRNLKFFELSWVHLHQNLSGKYRVSSLLNDSEPFDYLKSKSGANYQDGVYFHLNDKQDTGRHIPLPLLILGDDTSDLFLPNGNYNNDKFEIISYVTNTAKQVDANLWLTPPHRLHPSETEGGHELRAVNNSFSNTPSKRVGYVPRIHLETRIENELVDIYRHPIISLTGPGGIGKTSTAITVISKISQNDPSPFDIVLWISARDIDLLESGPREVLQNVFSKKDISRVAVDLLRPFLGDSANARNPPDVNHQFEEWLANGAAGGTILFVFDNFETVQHPAEVFNWIDHHVRLPNKVLITTRFRDFVGDYPIEIRGMSNGEANRLIEDQASRLGVEGLLTSRYRDKLIDKSQGHPYVIKILLGQVAKDNEVVSPDIFFVHSKHLLKALFERTFAALDPGGQRVFLLLSSWRVPVPEVAVEAVLLRPDTEPCDGVVALDELRRFSLVEEVYKGNEGERVVAVPLIASVYGKRKLEVSRFKSVVEQDRKILMEFGASSSFGTRRGVFPRIENLVRSVLRRTRRNIKELDTYLPILEYLASRVPKVYLRLADLMIDVEQNNANIEQAKGYVNNFLETADLHSRGPAWERFARLCGDSGDLSGEIHALSEAAILSRSPHNRISDYANRINKRIYQLKNSGEDHSRFSRIRDQLRKFITVMEKYRSSLSATECSRLAWLYLNVGDSDRAYDVAKLGLSRELSNEHCRNLIRILE